MTISDTTIVIPAIIPLSDVSLRVLVECDLFRDPETTKKKLFIKQGKSLYRELTPWVS